MSPVLGVLVEDSIRRRMAGITDDDVPVTFRITEYGLGTLEEEN